MIGYGRCRKPLYLKYHHVELSNRASLYRFFPIDDFLILLPRRVSPTVVCPRGMQPRYIWSVKHLLVNPPIVFHRSLLSLSDVSYSDLELSIPIPDCGLPP